jgi:hypothetical protein
MAEQTGAVGKQAYDVVGGATPLSYMLVKVKEFLSTFAGEDTANGVMKTEQRFAYSFVQADAAVKSAPGFLHALTFSCNDAAPTAGSIIVYDNTAESGTVIFNHTFTTTPFVPFTVVIDAVFAVGLYVGFTTTNDVNVTVSYR